MSLLLRKSFFLCGRPKRPFFPKRGLPLKRGTRAFLSTCPIWGTFLSWHLLVGDGMYNNSGKKGHILSNFKQERGKKVSRLKKKRAWGEKKRGVLGKRDIVREKKKARFHNSRKIFCSTSRGEVYHIFIKGGGMTCMVKEGKTLTPHHGTRNTQKKNMGGEKHYFSFQGDFLFLRGGGIYSLWKGGA